MGIVKMGPETLRNVVWKSASVLLVFAQLATCEGLHNYTRINKYARLRQITPKYTSYESVLSDWGHVDEDYDYNRHPCKRECVANEPMTCYYYFVVHGDQTMGPECSQYLAHTVRIKNAYAEFMMPFSVRSKSDHSTCKYADGVKTEIMLVNGELPGPAIEVCEGDTLVADVINALHEPTTIHWHGMHQLKSPHMDGAPHITQYPIMPGKAFRYRFEADHAGTNWWHSHVNHQRAFGLAGPMIVRQPDSLNVHANMYDFDLTEHTIMLQDWVHHFDETVPQNILVNGLGRNVNPPEPKVPTIYETFTVVQGARYRFRAIFNGVANCPISLTVDHHKLVVIASDGNDIEPIVVEKIIFNGAERFDFVIHANQAVNNFWIRIKGYSFCQFNNLHQEAILHYKGADRFEKPEGKVSYEYEPPGVELNSIDEAPSNDDKRITIVETTSLSLRVEPPITPYRTFYTSMAVHFKAQGFFFQMDDITFKMPKVSLLQARNLNIQGMFCNKTSLRLERRDCQESNCECTNVIQVPAFKYVEFVISSKTPTGHPIHLHGYTFRVVGMGVLGPERIENIEKIDKQTPLPRRKRGGPLKDSVQVPAFGYTIIRFYTNNPGYWLFHCHISTHSENGMTAVLKVGEDSQMKLCPVSNCGLCDSSL